MKLYAFWQTLNLNSQLEEQSQGAVHALVFSLRRWIQKAVVVAPSEPQIVKHVDRNGEAGDDYLLRGNRPHLAQGFRVRDRHRFHYLILSSLDD